MWLAVLLNRKIRLARFIRATVLLPFIVPTVLSGLAWVWMFDATFSVFNWMLRWLWQTTEWLFNADFGYFRGPRWLGDSTWAMFSIIMVNTWRGIPFFAISFLAGLQTVPGELYEAAAIDGASPWKRYTKITLPLLRPAILVAVLINVINVFNSFPIIWAMTEGGPQFDTSTSTVFMYKLAVQNRQLDTSAAMAVVNLALVFVVVLIFLRASRWQEATRAT